MANPGVVGVLERRSATRRALANRSFVVSYLAEAQSIVGDQLARVALAVLVFQLTGSTPATAATYAATFLPAIAGGFLLTRIGDRFSRRSVMVACDLLRAVCFGVIALRPDNIVLVVVLVVVAVSLGPVFSAAQVGLLAAILDLDEFTAGNAIRLVTSQAAQVTGFAVGGLVVAAIGPGDVLAVNAVTFALSALLIQLLMPADRVAREASVDPVPRGGDRDTAAAGGRPRIGLGLGAMWRDRASRPLVVTTLCIGFYVVPEGLAVPFAGSIGATSTQAGLLLACGALGGALGAATLMRREGARRAAWANTSSVLCGVPLVASGVLMAMTHAWWLAAVCWLASGVFAAYVVHTMSALVHAIPDDLRSRTVGALSALVLGSQGLAVLAFGALAAVVSPSAAVAIAGGTGTAITLIVLATARSAPRGRHALAT